MAKRSYSPSKCDAQRVEWKSSAVVASYTAGRSGKCFSTPDEH